MGVLLSPHIIQGKNPSLLNRPFFALGHWSRAEAVLRLAGLMTYAPSLGCTGLRNSNASSFGVVAITASYQLINAKYWTKEPICVSLNKHLRISAQFKP